MEENEIKNMTLNEKLDIIENFLWDLKDCPNHIQLVWNSFLEEIGF